MLKRIALGSALVALLSAGAASAFELETAKAMAAGCEAKAVAEGWKMNIAIVDVGADLVYFQRMDGAFLGSVEIAQRKAESSARLPFPTRTLAEISFGKDGEPGGVPGLALIEGLAAFPGGLPIKAADGTLLGAIGVSGATGDQDEECAQAGLDAVADQLN